MPLNNFNVGSDCRLVIRHPLAPGGELQIADVTGFKADQKTKALNYTRLDGQTLNGEYPMGWSGTFDVERASDAVDSFIANLENAALNNQNVQGGDVYQYITEVDGSTSTYHFTGVAFKLTDAGNYQGAETVKQTLAMEASRRIKV